MKRHRGIGLISHITPAALPIFIVLFYVPVIALPLRMHGWTRGAAFGMGFLLPVAWFAIGAGISTAVPARFAKLKDVLDIGILSLPMLGMVVLPLWDLANFLWHLAR